MGDSFLKKTFKYTIEPVLNIVLLGVESPKNSFQSRITLLTNIMACWGIVTVVGTALTLQTQGIGMEYYGISYSLLSLSCFVILFLNYKKRKFAARITAVLLLYIAAWQAAFIFGKSFNGYLIFYIGIFYTIIALYGEKNKILWWLLGLGVLSVFLNDYLYHSDILPLTRLHSSKFPVSVLWVDSLFIALFITITLLIEKAQSQKHEESLESINSDLENIVKRRTEMLLQAKEEAYQYNILKAQFVANTSHEIRTPLQGIVGFLQLSQIHFDKLKSSFTNNAQNSEAEKLQKSLESLNISTQRLHTLINRLLELTRVEENNFAPRPIDFNIDQLLKKIILDLEQHNPGKKIALHINKPDNEFNCYTDPILIQQVLEALLDNASKYGQTDSAIHVILESDEVHASVTIVNSGVGIREVERESIFEAFVQGSLTNKMTGGTGLGLSLARKYARILNGEVILADLNKESTTFIFQFPKKYDV